MEALGAGFYVQSHVSANRVWRKRRRRWRSHVHNEPRGIKNGEDMGMENELLEVRGFFHGLMCSGGQLDP